MEPGTVANVGGSQPHNNSQPFLALNFCIALQGIFPSRN
jgi:microcystin-dependent protein